MVEPMRFRRQKAITVVSGLPRSGTSLMMQMLQAGGIPVLTDDIRTPDENNPRGYYEYEPVKRLHQGEYHWLKQAQGKAVKVVTPLLAYLPPTYPYHIILMERNLDEILHSQWAMLNRMGQSTDHFDRVNLHKQYQQQLEQVRQRYKTALVINYNHLIQQPEPYIKQLRQFLPRWINTQAMQTVIEPSLHRSKHNQGHSHSA